MRDIALRALDTARSRGANYADVRALHRQAESVTVRLQNVEALTFDETHGFGVRALVDGFWGFASSHLLTMEEADRVAAEAVRIARASATVRGRKADLGPTMTIVDSYTTPVQQDPFAVSLDDKIALLLRASKSMMSVSNIVMAEANSYCQREEKLFVSTEGSDLQQTLVETGCGIEATAVDEGEVQRRSYPNSVGRHQGTEAAFAGTSFLTTDKLGSYRYGSPVINITADATVPGGLGTFGYDDEGVPAHATPVVREGTFVGYLTSRETATALGQTSNGAMRASGWNRIPLIRMTNVNLDPGDWTLDDLIADTEDGIYMETNRSWSIDDRRLNFQFGTEVGREIKNGKLGDLIKNATYTGITPQFWGSCDAVGNADHWLVWGTPNCGKGQPEQVAHTGHGAAPARFRNVQVGIMR